jgi:hypothetical protein
VALRFGADDELPDTSLRAVGIAGLWA